MNLPGHRPDQSSMPGAAQAPASKSPSRQGAERSPMRSNTFGSPLVRLLVAAAVAAVLLPAAPAAADDAATCRRASGAAALEACTRSIESGTYQGHALAVLLYNRGYEYHDADDHDRAIADFNEAIRIDPGYAKAFYGRAGRYAAKRDYVRALADYDEAIRLDP